MVTIGDVIKQLREKAGFSQSVLARKAGIELGTLQGYEQDRFGPRMIKAAQLENALGVPPGTIVKTLLKERKKHGET